MSAATLDWVTFRPVTPISTVAAFFTMPAFSVGTLRNYLLFSPLAGSFQAAANGAATGLSPKRDYTIEARVKPTTANQTGGILAIHETTGTSYAVILGLSNGFLTFTVSIAANYTVTSTTKLAIGSWSNVSVTISAAGLITLTDPFGSYTTAGVPAFALAGVQEVFVGLDLTLAPFVGGVQYVRLWDHERTTEIARDAMKFFIDDTTGLEGLWRFQEGSGTTVEDDSSNTNTLTLSAYLSGPLPSWEPDDLYWPGASWIVKQWSVLATNRFSLPTVSKPSGVNYVLAVRWTDRMGVVRRFKLWDHDDVVLNSPVYDGRVIEAAFELEVWSIRAVGTFSQASDLNITSSIRKVVTDFSAVPADYLNVAAVDDGPAAFTLTDSTTGEATLPLS